MVFLKNGIARIYDSIRPSKFLVYIFPTSHTPKFVIMKNNIDDKRVPATICFTLLCFFNHKPITPVIRKLPYTNGIVLCNPRKRSDIKSVKIGTTNAYFLLK